MKAATWNAGRKAASAAARNASACSTVARPDACSWEATS